MARLTWWDYSWDVMEPISFFLTFGTGILGYIFFMLTRQEYTFLALGDVTVSRLQHRMYRKYKLNLHEYLRLRRQVSDEITLHADFKQVAVFELKQ